MLTRVLHFALQIEAVIQRRTLWDTFVMVTTRPHSEEIEQIRRLMGNLAKIKGFSDKDARHYILKILEDEAKLDGFMEQVRKNDLREFLRIPFIALALSMVYLNVEPPELPNTMTGTVYIRVPNTMTGTGHIRVPNTMTGTGHIRVPNTMTGTGHIRVRVEEAPFCPEI